MLGNSELALVLKILAEGKQARSEITGVRAHYAKETKGITDDFKNAGAQVAQSVGTAEKANTSFGSSVGSTVLKIAGMAAVATAAVSGLYAFALSATKAAADLKDLSDQTGFQVETLSALDLILQATGGNIQSASSALNIFQTNMVKAREGNKQYAATFRELNIATEDNEKALRDAFRAIAALRSEEEQMNKARVLFGKSGAQVLAVIRETNGNLDVAIEKFRALGTLIDTETAEAADRFHDSMAAAGQQASALGRNVAMDLLPALTGLLSLLQSVMTILTPVTWLIGQLGTAVQLAAEVIHQIATLSPGGGGMPESEFVDGGPTFFGKTQAEWDAMRTPGKTGGGRGGGAAKENPRIKQLEEQEKEAERIYKAETDALKDEYDRRKINLITYTQDAARLAKELFESRRAVILQQRALAKPEDQGKYDTELTDAEADKDASVMKAWRDAEKQLLKFKRELQEKILDLQDEFDQRNVAAIEGRIKLEVGTEVKGLQQIAAIQEAAYKRREADLIAQREALRAAAQDQGEAETLEEVQRLDAQLNIIRQHWVTRKEENERQIGEAQARALDNETQYQEKVFQTLKQFGERRRDEERRMAEASLNSPWSSLRQRRLAIVKLAELDLFEIDRKHDYNNALLDEDERKAKAELKNLEDKERKRLEIEQLYNALREQERERHANERAERDSKGNDDVTFEGTGGDPWAAVVGQFTDNAEVIKAAGALIANTFNEIGQAAGAAVRAFIVFGSTGTSFRKVATDVIASIASMAVVQAIWEGAQAAAMYALFYFTGGANFLKSAIAHGQAAAMYGIVAAAAVPIGRAISPQNSAAASAGAGAGAGANSNTEPREQRFNYGSQSSPSSSTQGEGSRSISQLNISFQKVNETLERLNGQVSRLQSMPAGHVVGVGLQENPQAAGVAVLEHQRGDHGFTQEMLGNLGFAR